MTGLRRVDVSHLNKEPILWGMLNETAQWTKQAFAATNSTSSMATSTGPSRAASAMAVDSKGRKSSTKSSHHGKKSKTAVHKGPTCVLPSAPSVLKIPLPKRFVLFVVCLYISSCAPYFFVCLLLFKF